MPNNIEHTYGDRFAELLPKTVADIEKEIALLSNNILNGKVADRQKLSYLLENEAELKRYINERYGISYTESTGGAYADSVAMNKSIFEGENIAFGFRQDQLDVMSQMKRRNVLLYQIETSKAANVVFDSMISWAYTGNAKTLAPFEALVGEMGASKYGSTIINTQISAFDRSVTAMAAENAGVERFIYRGPKPDRPFCIPRVNKVFTLEEINAMDNGQTSDVLTTAGGYNCRHRWVPVQDESGGEVEEVETVKPKSKKDVINELNKSQAQAIKTTNKTDLQSLNQYTDLSYRDWNGILRAGGSPNAGIKGTSSALKNFPKYSGSVVRGTSYDVEEEIEKALLKYSKGNIVTEKAFTSSTIDDRVLGLFGGESRNTIKFDIKSKNGRAVWLASDRSDEFEVLFDRDTSFIIKDVKKIPVKSSFGDSFRYEVNMEEV